MTDSFVIQAVLLAAGKSKRFGHLDKTHLEIDGVAMAIKTALLFTPIVESVLIVLSEDNKLLQDLAKTENIDVVINDSLNNSGIGSSVSLSVSSRPSVDAWLFCPADMPFIKSETIVKVVDAIRKSDDKTIVVPRYNNRNGHPVCFGRFYKQALLERSGDVGARTIIKKNAHAIHYIDVDDAGVCRDVDVPSDILL